MRALAILLIVAACGEPSREIQLERATPDHGPLIGGTSITITGTGFLSDGAAPNRVLIGGRQAPLAGAIDDTTLQVVIPPGERPGDVEIVVLNRNGNTSATGIFHYSTPPTITAVAPADVVFSSATRMTVTGSGFLDEGAGDVHVLVEGQLASDVEVTSDTSLTFTAPPGPPLGRPDLEIVDTRGTATESRAFRYVPSARGGLLLFPPWSATFAVFFDPVDNSTVTIPAVGPVAGGFTAVVRDEQGDYWGLDRNQRFGRIDMTTQLLENPIQAQGWFPTMMRAGGEYFALERNALRFGSFDPVTGTFASIGDAMIPCCGSYGLASDGTTVHYTSRQGATVSINTIDPTTGVAGTPVTVLAGPQFHVEEMRFFNHTLYASSRDGTLVAIDPTTGHTTLLPVNLGRFKAMEVFE